MAEPWRYRTAKIGWTKLVRLPIIPPLHTIFVVRYFASGGYWSACVYRGPWIKPAAIVAGTRSRHDSPAAARRKLLTWVREQKTWLREHRTKGQMWP